MRDVIHGTGQFQARSAEGRRLSPRCLRRRWCFHLGRAQEELVWWGERCGHSSFQSLLLPWLQTHCPQEQEEMSNTQITSFTLQMEIWSAGSLSSKLKVTKPTGVEPWVWRLANPTLLQGQCRLWSVLIHSTKHHLNFFFTFWLFSCLLYTYWVCIPITADL